MNGRKGTGLDVGEQQWRKVKGLAKFQQLKRVTVVVANDMDLFKVSVTGDGMR